jgi:hypothetical protein
MSVPVDYALPPVYFSSPVPSASAVAAQAPSGSTYMSPKLRAISHLTASHIYAARLARVFWYCGTPPPRGYHTASPFFRRHHSPKVTGVPDLFRQPVFGRRRHITQTQQDHTRIPRKETEGDKGRGGGGGGATQRARFWGVCPPI